MTLRITTRTTEKDKLSRGLPATATVKDVGAKRCFDAVYENLRWLINAVAALQALVMNPPTKTTVSSSTTLEAGTGITVEQSGTDKWKISASSETTILAGEGIEVVKNGTSSWTVTATGVIELTAGSGISVIETSPDHWTIAATGSGTGTVTDVQIRNNYDGSHLLEYRIEKGGVWGTWIAISSEVMGVKA